MSKIAIVTDSNSGITQAMGEELEILMENCFLKISHFHRKNSIRN